MACDDDCLGRERHEGPGRRLVTELLDFKSGTAQAEQPPTCQFAFVFRSKGLRDANQRPKRCVLMRALEPSLQLSVLRRVEGRVPASSEAARVYPGYVGHRLVQARLRASLEGPRPSIIRPDSNCRA